MTRSDFELVKGPFSANDNFQEWNSPSHDEAGSDFPRYFRKLVAKDGPEIGRDAVQCSSMVSGTAEPEAASGGIPPTGQSTGSWTAKYKIGRRKVSRSLKLAEVQDLQSAWHHARTIGLPLNRFITFRPFDINEQAPAERVQTWTHWRNKLAQYARDNGFDFACIWTRESQRETALNEHMHVLMHVPVDLRRRFDKVVRGWCDGSEEIDVRQCSYQTKTNHKGGPSNVLTYISKNSPQAGRFLDRIIQLGGPIFGKRYGLSRNLTAGARSRAEVAGGLRRDLGLVSITRDARLPPPQPANDHGQDRNRRNAA